EGRGGGGEGNSGKRLRLGLLETQVRVRAVLEQRLDDRDDAVFLRKVDTIVRIPHDKQQWVVATPIRYVGVGAIVEQQIHHLGVAHGAGDDQGGHFSRPVIRFRAGSQQNAGGLHVILLGCKHQRSVL